MQRYSNKKDVTLKQNKTKTNWDTSQMLLYFKAQSIMLCFK